MMIDLSNGLLSILEQYSNVAILISITINIIIAIVGILPTFFLTIANIYFFGFTIGLLISIIGESFGAIISFYIYRKFLKRLKISKKISENKIVNKLLTAGNREQLKLIFLFRIFPYVPSGAITYASAISNVNIFYFTISSTLGKIPSLFLEATISLGIISFLSSTQLNLILVLIATIGIYITIKLIFKDKGSHEK